MNITVKTYTDTQTHLTVKTTESNTAATYKIETVINNIAINIDAFQASGAVTLVLSIDGAPFDVVQTSIINSRRALHEVLKNCFNYYDKKRSYAVTAALYQLQCFLIAIEHHEAEKILKVLINIINERLKKGGSEARWEFAPLNNNYLIEVGDRGRYDILEVDAVRGVVYINSTEIGEGSRTLIKNIFKGGEWTITPVIKKEKTDAGGWSLRNCDRTAFCII